MKKKRTTLARIGDVNAIQGDLYTAIEGTPSNACLVLANYYPLPFDAEEINSCVIEVKSFPDRTEWVPILTLPLWVHSITRLSAGGFLLGSNDGTLIRVINDAVEEIRLGLTV